MSKKKPKKNSLRLAGVFIIVVLGLIFLSLLAKLFFVVKESKFDGNHKFNVAISGSNKTMVVSFSPNPRSISVLNLPQAPGNVSEFLEVPIDGSINVNKTIQTSGISQILLKSEFSFGNSVKKLTPIDLFRLFLFTRTVISSQFYERDLLHGLTNAQKSTLISLTFTDPDIYRENQSIEIINASDVNGLGARLAQFITNIGGNVVLVTGQDKRETASKLIYSGEKTYTVEKISSFFQIPKEEQSQKGIADVIIVIGEDLAGRKDF